MTKRSCIDFLGLGMHRSGSSWLWQMLQQHPDISMPVKKELHYFDRLEDVLYPPKSGCPRGRFLKMLSVKLAQACQPKVLLHLFWYLKYTFFPRHDEWYLSLFNPDESRCVGEITPAYFYLSLAQIERIYGLFPDLKLLVILRDPVARSWSHMRFNYQQGRLDSLACQAFLSSNLLARYNDYQGALDRWLSVFPKAQLLVLDYAEISLSPQTFMNRITGFLELDDLSLPDNTFKHKVNMSQPLALSAEFSQLLDENCIAATRTYLNYQEKVEGNGA